MATFEAHQYIRFSMGCNRTIYLWCGKLDIWPWKFKVKVTAMDASANNDSMAENEPSHTLEGPEDRHLRNYSFGSHVTSLTLQYLWPRPPGVWLGGPGCKPGHSGRS